MKLRHAAALALVGWYHRCSVGILQIHETPLGARGRNTKMVVDLLMEPYATMFENERPESRIIEELCFPDIDKLFGHLGMRWDDYSIDAVNGRLPHDAALRLLAAVESHQLPPELNRGNARSALIDKRDKLLVLLHYYRNWYEHPDRVPTQMQGISKGRAPGMEGRIGHLPDKRPWLVVR
jgi:hypothetical protein